VEINYLKHIQNMEEMEEFEENMLATCNFFDERQEIIQLQTESITLATFMDMDQLYKELKPLINSISEFDFANPATIRKEKWPAYEIYDDGKGPLMIVFLFRNRLNTYNSDGCVNENEEEPEFVYSIVIARVFDAGETYYEPIKEEIHYWMKKQYEKLLKTAEV
jgi:hypothetical protein